MSLKFTLGRTVFGLSLLVGAALNYLVLDYKFGGYFSVTYPYLVCDYGLPLSEKLNLLIIMGMIPPALVGLLNGVCGKDSIREKLCTFILWAFFSLPVIVSAWLITLPIYYIAKATFAVVSYIGSAVASLIPTVTFTQSGVTILCSAAILVAGACVGSCALKKQVG